jgi:hypothetical protein
MKYYKNILIMFSHLHKIIIFYEFDSLWLSITMRDAYESPKNCLNRSLKIFSHFIRFDLAIHLMGEIDHIPNI